MAVRFTHKGDFNGFERLCNRLLNMDYLNILEKYGQIGVRALQRATPVDSGKTASSWSYEIQNKKDEVTLTWTNSNVNDGCNVAILLQYGHGTKNGAYVQGIDYINPALKPIFDNIAESVWKEALKT